MSDWNISYFGRSFEDSLLWKWQKVPCAMTKICVPLVQIEFYNSIQFPLQIELWLNYLRYQSINSESVSGLCGGSLHPPPVRTPRRPLSVSHIPAIPHDYWVIHHVRPLSCDPSTFVSDSLHTHGCAMCQTRVTRVFALGIRFQVCTRVGEKWNACWFLQYLYPCEILLKCSKGAQYFKITCSFNMKVGMYMCYIHGVHVNKNPTYDHAHCTWYRVLQVVLLNGQFTSLASFTVEKAMRVLINGLFAIPNGLFTPLVSFAEECAILVLTNGQFTPLGLFARERDFCTL